ncbi:MAG: peroxiredoxin [Flavobacterium sp.]|nr:peroxiredoxin [Flavobacterium sp.]MBP6100172.1 peroxiredoxin [Flavobacterium sp.]
MALSVGDVVPHFTAKDENGLPFDSTNCIGKQITVLYFYPKDNTPGCTAQACEFRDQYEDFLNYGALVIGVSSDGASSHSKFKSRYKLPFTLLSDPTKKISKLFGVANDLLFLPGRETFVIDSEGVIQMKFDSMQAKSHISKALDKVKDLASR